MSTLSVPLTPKLEEAINRMVRDGVAETKAAVVRRAVRLLEEEEAIASIRESRQEIKEGKGIKGDLRKILKQFPD